jgi:hypothetical protein
MIEADETVSTRSIMRRLPNDFTYPTAVTRPAEMRKLYLDGRKSQREFRALYKRSKASRAQLQVRIQQLVDVNAELLDQVELLTASHRAMYMALTEVGGYKAWLSFFDAKSAAIRKLAELKAIPDKVASIWEATARPSRPKS